MSEIEKPAHSEKKQSEGGLFTGRLTWWQILLGLALVGYLLYGKYQETKANAQPSPAVAPAKTN